MLKKAVRAIYNKNFDLMKTIVEQNLKDKAIVKMEEMKLSIAKNYFGKK